MSKGRLPLPELIIGAATVYDTLHVAPARQFIEQQQALFKKVDNELDRLNVCKGCLHYYDPKLGVECANIECDQHVSCGDENCQSLNRNICNGCGNVFCDFVYGGYCVDRCDVIGCEQLSLCRNCRQECCGVSYCRDHRIKCVLCDEAVCEACYVECATCGAGPWCESTARHEGIIAILNDDYYCVDCLQRCSVCEKLSLEVITCGVCSFEVCAEHNSGECELCGAQRCCECAITCSECQGGVCPSCCTGTICHNCPNEEEDPRTYKRHKK